MEFLKSDKVKVIAAVLAAVCGALFYFYPPPNQIGQIAAIVGYTLVSLGLVSGGIAVTQPKPPPAAPPST